MKISKLFHWLYASLCFLPLLVAPIFALAVRSDNNFAPIEVQSQENVKVDFNQQFQYDLFPIHNENLRVISNYGNVSVSRDEYTTILSGNTSGNNCYYITNNITFNAHQNDKLLIRHQYNDTILHDLSTWGCGLRLDSIYNYFEDTIFIFDNINVSYTAFWRISGGYTFDELEFCLQLFNLTQMFGVGNEPTLNQFNAWYSDYYYDFTLSDKQILRDVVITYNDTDVGSQLLYTLYNTTEKYMNFDDVLNLKLINEWINLNVFNGNAPLIWTIIWHYLDYWLLLSIFWLCFDVLIYVPQLAHRWLDKASLE